MYLNENNVILMQMVNNYLVHTLDRNFHLKSRNECTVYEDLLNQTPVRLHNDFDMLTI